jgi:hypothetical protein
VSRFELDRNGPYSDTKCKQVKEIIWRTLSFATMRSPRLTVNRRANRHSQKHQRVSLAPANAVDEVRVYPIGYPRNTDR